MSLRIVLLGVSVSDVFIGLDIYSRENFHQSINFLPKNLTKPQYDGVIWSLNQYYSDLFHQKGDLRLLSEVTAPRSTLFGFASVGGLFIVDVERYRLFGWENEHFIGWGPEDAERHHRLTILGHPPVIIPGEIYHLYHSRGINSGYVVEEVTLATKSEYCKVCSMWPDELRAYVDSWQWKNSGYCRQ